MAALPPAPMRVGNYCAHAGLSWGHLPTTTEVPDKEDAVDFFACCGTVCCDEFEPCQHSP
jgi:hypothetical protein